MSDDILDFIAPPVNVSDPFDAPGISKEFHDSVSVSLGELIEGGFFSWNDPKFDWSGSAHSPEQFERVCKGFELAFYYREIGILPPKRWANKVLYTFEYILCPKYNRAYDALEDVNILTVSDKYGKSREVHSDYPETLLSDNSDYLSTGRDAQHEDVETGNPVELYERFRDSWIDIDNAMISEAGRLLFSDMIAPNVNDY